ncbi:MAG: ABC transporter permease subunit [Streptococcaceae bacterium]|jgi:molybdate transport system permease protein|nr:ABC transporter permease subunit [Streptococcaceae bacterium]
MIIPILHSLIVAFAATTIAFILMLPLAYVGAFLKYPGKWLVETFLLLPLVLPPTVVGLYILEVFGKYGPLGFFNSAFIFSLSGSVLATTIIIFPIVYQGLKGALTSVSTDLTDAGKVAGANSRQLLTHVLLPNSTTIVIITLLLSFCRALGEFGASLMVAGYIPGRTDTLANSIYFAVQNGQNNTALGLSAINVLFGALVLGIVYALNRRNMVK